MYQQELALSESTGAAERDDSREGARKWTKIQWWNNRRQVAMNFKRIVRYR
jgi:hypothetical protein